jgi:hypothetical protein
MAASDTHAHAEKLGLEANAFIKMHKTAESVMAKYGFESTSKLEQAFGPNPVIPGITTPKITKNSAAAPAPVKS